MKLRLATTALAAALGAGLMAHADPPHSRPGDLPPGLAKQGKIPPGHAKKMWKKLSSIGVWYLVILNL